MFQDNVLCIQVSVDRDISSSKQLITERLEKDPVCKYILSYVRRHTPCNYVIPHMVNISVLKCIRKIL